MRTQRLRFVLFVGLTAPLALLAQQGLSPVVITVSDPFGARVAHAQVRLIPAPDPAPAKMETNDRGELALNLKPGGYALFVQMAGFTAIPTHIGVKTSRETQAIPVVMQLAPTGSPTVYGESDKDDLLLSAFPYHPDVLLKAAQFKGLPQVSITVHNPHSDTQETYSGVRVADLLGLVGAPLGKEFHGVALAAYLIFHGSDGYEAVLALAEVNPEFHPGDVIVADSMNGKPLDAKSGPFKLVVTEDKRPARWVRSLDTIALKFAN
jgi:hypothetical protein